MTSFLDDPTDIDDGKGSSKMDSIGLVKFSICYRAGFNHDEVAYFEFDHNDRATMPDARSAAWKHINEKKIVGYEGKKAFPQLGVLCEIPLATNLSAGDNLEKDLFYFTSEYLSNKHQLGDEGKLTQDQQSLVTGSMPYDVVLDSLRKFPEVIGKFVWMKLGKDKNNFSVATGKLNDKGYPKYPVSVIREIYANEEEARQAAGTEIKENAFDDFGGAVTPPDSKLSDLAVTNQWTERALIDTLPSMEQNIIDVMAGKNPENKRMTKTEAANYVCGEYSISVKDLDFARNMVIEEPF